MNRVIEELQKYLLDTLDVQVILTHWKEQANLPFFLVDSYDFFETLILGEKCLLIVGKFGLETTPATIQKHLELLMKKWNAHCIYVQSSISSHDRKRLIRHRIPFIIPNSQLYLPDLGVALRQHFRVLRSPKKFFSPATQALIIFALLQENEIMFTPSQLAKKIGYTSMTLTRSLNELEMASIGEVVRKGKERWWLFNEGKRELWEQAKPMMRSPVKARTWVRREKPKLLAGLSSLAEMTLLNQPNLPVYAMGLEEISEIEKLPSADEASCELEIWHYDPALFAKNGMVDPFSLYLSLETIEDERVVSALKILMEKIKW